jgi:Ribbon-helix-helix protein, copG family
MVMSKSEVDMLKQLAEANGISQSDFVRVLIHKAHRDFLKEQNGPQNGRREERS